jgi:predicted glycosyltransferase involved in capsule biosynthesis
VIKVGDIVTVTHLDKRGKQLIKDLGDQWTVVQVKDKVLFNPDPGPWLFIEPIGSTSVINTRWIHETGNYPQYRFKIVEK